MRNRSLTCLWVLFQVAKEFQSQTAPYDQYRFFANRMCRPNYGGGFGSLVPYYNRTIVVSPFAV